MWGGIVPHPSEFGNADFYNDHHFQYGYLIAAAAAVAEVDPQELDEQIGTASSGRGTTTQYRAPSRLISALGSQARSTRR